VQIVFYDRGTGITSDLMDKIMNPFFTTKPSGLGTGLGLSISHGIISSHGGTMTIESVEGEFTKVKICLPAKSGP
jgi:signal transduction histidine kinase